jgi:Ca2+-binding RTX toxin-like protein
MATPTVWLNEIQSNTGTASTPTTSDPQTIGLSNGNILVAWVEAGTTGVGFHVGDDIIGKIYDGAGNLVIDSFRINYSRTADDENDFDIAATNDGGFMLVYVDNDAAGTRVVWERKNVAGVNTHTTDIVSEIGFGNYANPQIAINNFDNSAFISYTALNPAVFVDPEDEDVIAVYIDAVGTIITAEFEATNDTILFSGADQTQNSVAININGEMVSAYRDEGVVKVSVLSTTGVLQHTVTVDGTGSPSDPQVATLTNGNIVVTWTDDISGGSSGDVSRAVYDGNLVVVQAKLSINDTDANGTSIVALPSGEFLVIWDDNSADNDIKGQKFDSNGVADGAIFTVSIFGGASPSVGVTGDGRVIFTYEDLGDVWTSIWDPRDGDITTNNYDSPQEQFVVGDTIWAKTTGGNIFGDSGTPERIIGSEVEDVLRGFAGNDTLEGNGGNDVLDGSTGNDSMSGGAGDDAFYFFAGVAEGADTIDGGADFDALVLFDPGTTDLSAAGTQWSGLEQINFAGIGNEPGSKTLIVRGDEVTDGFVSGVAVEGQSNTILREIIQVQMDSDTSIDLSNTSFIQWTDGFDFIRIVGDTSNETITGTLGSDSVSAEDGDDDIILTAATTGLEETISGGNGYDEIVITSTGLIDLSNVGTQISGIEEIRFDVLGASTVRLGSEETDSALELLNVIIDGYSGPGGGRNLVEVVMNTGSANLSGWTFQDWDTSGSDEFIRITGDSSSESVVGSSVRDLIEVKAGNDTVDAGAGNDTIIATSGLNNLDGGADDDLFELSGDAFLNQTIVGGLGNDTIDFSTSAGGSSALVTGIDLDGGYSANGAPASGSWSGLEGAVGFTGNRNDITGNGSDNALTGGGLGDTIDGGNGVDTIMGLGGDDSLLGGNGIDSIDGGAGDDTINGGSGKDELSGGLGDDVFQIINADFADDIDGGGDTDTLDLSGWTSVGVAWDVDLASETYELAPNTIGSIGMSTMANVENVIGSDFNDSIVGSGGANEISGGSGADTIFGFGGEDTLSGNSGADEVRGNGGDDIVGGEGGNDVVFGGEGNDSVYGGGGNDTLNGGTGNDLLNGGGNFDIADYSDATTNLVVNINFGGAQTISAQMGTDTFVSIEGINGGSGNDLLVGTSGGNVIDGGAGNDEIYGIGAGDLLRGGIGNDQIEGSGGDDTMEGGVGDADILSYFNSGGSVAVDLRFQGTEQAVGGFSGTDTFTGFEDLYGSNAAGTDILIGNHDDSRILGFGGDDRLFGFDGADELFGMQGNDSLSGGNGQDTLAGGGGADAFLFNDVLHSTSADRDTITDFGVGGADRINLSVIDANTIAGDNQAFNFVGSAGFGAAGDLRFATNGTNGFVLGDVDGDGTADLNILLLGVTAMTTGDFVL